VGAAKRLKGQADPDLLTHRFRDVHRAIWSNQIDLLLNTFLIGKDISFSNFKVEWIRQRLQASDTSQLDLRSQATLSIEAVVDTGELDFSLEKVYLQVFIQCPSLFLNVDSCTGTQ